MRITFYGYNTFIIESQDTMIATVQITQPGLVIPCRYNCPAFSTKKYNPANEIAFKQEVESLDLQCAFLNIGDTLELPDS